MTERFGVYICHKSAFNLFEDIVLKIELAERSDACVRDVPAQYHHNYVTVCHICHGLVSQSGGVDECRTPRKVSRCTVCPVHTS